MVYYFQHYFFVKQEIEVHFWTAAKIQLLSKNSFLMKSCQMTYLNFRAKILICTLIIEYLTYGNDNKCENYLDEMKFFLLPKINENLLKKLASLVI